MVDPSRRLRSPGHDKAVARAYYLKDRPTIFQSRILSGRDPARVAGEVGDMLSRLRTGAGEAQLQREYTPDLVRVTPPQDANPPGYLFVVRRTRADEDAGALWQAFVERLDTFSRTGELPALDRPAGG